MKKEQIKFVSLHDKNEKYDAPFMEFSVLLPLPNSVAHTLIQHIPVYVSIPTLTNLFSDYLDLTLRELIERGKEAVLDNVIKSL